MIQQINIIKELGSTLDSQSMILDFGCGNGELVKEYRKNGYLAFGCDLEFKKDNKILSHENNETFRLIDKESYRIPFNDNTFDYVFSYQVLEHVQSYSQTLAEIKRVLKPGGVSLHIFPSRYCLIEAHSFVPFASILQKDWWFVVWAYLGISNKYLKGQTPAETGSRTGAYLRECTNYLTKAEIREYVKKRKTPQGRKPLRVKVENPSGSILLSKTPQGQFFYLDKSLSKGRKPLRVNSFILTSPSPNVEPAPSF